MATHRSELLVHAGDAGRERDGMAGIGIDPNPTSGAVHKVGKGCQLAPPAQAASLCRSSRPVVGSGTGDDGHMGSAVEGWPPKAPARGRNLTTWEAPGSRGGKVGGSGTWTVLSMERSIPRPNLAPDSPHRDPIDPASRADLLGDRSRHPTAASVAASVHQIALPDIRVGVGRSLVRWPGRSTNCSTHATGRGEAPSSKMRHHGARCGIP